MSFEPATTRFSAVNAEALALAATIAYEVDNTKAQRRAEEELGLDQFFEPFEHHNFVIDTEGFVAASKQHVVLAFRGTEPGKIKDWATDALAAPTAFRWFFDRAPDVGYVHSGFANSLRDSWAESIRRLLNKAGAGTSQPCGSPPTSPVGRDVTTESIDFSRLTLQPCNGPLTKSLPQ